MPNRRTSRRYPDLEAFSSLAGDDEPCGACQVAHTVFADALHRVAHPIILLGSSSEVLFANRAARRTLASSAVFSVRQNCLRVKVDGTYVRALSLNGRGAMQSTHVLGPCTALKTRLAVEFTAVPVPNPMPSAATSRLWLLQWILIDRAATVQADVLRQVFDLSPAEAALVALLHGGYSLAAAARALGRSIHTTKTQLRHAFSKTQTRNQAALLLAVDRVARFGP